MTGDQTNITMEDDTADIEKLLAELENWSSEIFCNDWRLIENSGSTSSEYYDNEKDAASERNYQRLLKIERLRVRLLCSV